MKYDENKLIYLQENITKDLKKIKNFAVKIIMKETGMVRLKPQRLRDWGNIVSEIV